MQARSSLFACRAAEAVFALWIALPLPSLLNAQDGQTAPQGSSQIIPLWPAGKIPPNTSKAQEHIVSSDDGTRFLVNVTEPTLTMFPPTTKANGTAAVICPGGAYHFLAIDYEGYDVAKWLSGMGVTAFVVKYRVHSTGKHPLEEVDELLHKNHTELEKRLMITIPLSDEDGRQAIRIVRQRAAEWGLDPHRIVLIGFSAGGGITTDIALVHDAQSRPDFAVPVYPVVPQKFDVPGDAPPLFIAAADDDTLLKPSEHAVRLYAQWNQAGKPAEIHIYSKGGHGFGMKTRNMPVDGWKDRLADWMRVEKLLEPSS